MVRDCSIIRKTHVSPVAFEVDSYSTPGVRSLLPWPLSGIMQAFHDGSTHEVVTEAQYLDSQYLAYPDSAIPRLLCTMPEPT